MIAASKVGAGRMATPLAGSGSTVSGESLTGSGICLPIVVAVL
jgi:hypothetical protein